MHEGGAAAVHRPRLLQIVRVEIEVPPCQETKENGAEETADGHDAADVALDCLIGRGEGEDRGESTELERAQEEQSYREVGERLPPRKSEHVKADVAIMDGVGYPEGLPVAGEQVLLPLA